MGATQSFYGRNRRQECFPPGPSNSEIHSILQSMSCCLSDVQRQLVIIQEQNSERDSTMKKLVEEVRDLKEKQPSLSSDIDETPKSKRSRKSPRGLSVSNFVKQFFVFSVITIGMCPTGTQCI